MASGKKSQPRTQDAQMRLIAAFSRFFLNLVNLRVFVGTTGSAMERGKESIHDEWKQGARTVLHAPELKRVLGKVAAEPQFVDDFSEALARRSIRLAGQTVNAAGLVFAHSLLDGLISDCCQISFMAKPQDWFGFVENRKVDFAALKTQKAKTLLQQNAADFIKQLGRESMEKRFGLLHKVCAPKIKHGRLPTAWIKHAELEAFDDLRHRIVHGTSFSRRIKDFEHQVDFANRAGLSILLLIQEAYHLLENEDVSAVSSVRFLRIIAAVKKEFPECLELFEKYADALSPNLLKNIGEVADVQG